MQIQDILRNDYGDVLRLNEASLPHVNRIGERELQWFADNAAYCRTAHIEDRLAAFLIGLRPGTSYQSPNYRWFCSRFEDFAYIDRVAVASWARRQGVADALYRDFAESQSGVPRLTCEVNLCPPNEGSMRFHERFGFRQIDTQETEGGNKEVALLELTL